MSVLSLDEYQDFAAISAIYNPDKYAIIYPAIGLANEAGEVLGKVKKVLRDNNGEFTEEWKEKIADELGDVLWYLSSTAKDIGYTLERIAMKNMNKLKDRRERNVIHGSGDNR